MKYDVALSFAGEDREYVDQVADDLRRSGVAVFYDRYEQTDLWGRDLYEHLSDVYQNRARYTVMFISRHYAEKLWTRHERKSAQARAFRESGEYILPARFDDTEVPGLASTVGYLDLRHLTPAQLSTSIREKLNDAGGTRAAGLVRRSLADERPASLLRRMSHSGWAPAAYAMMLLAGTLALVFLISSFASRPVGGHPDSRFGGIPGERDTTTVDLTIMADAPILLSDGRVSKDGTEVGAERIRNLFAREVRPEGSWWVLTDTSSMYPVPRRVLGDVRRMLVEVANQGPKTLSPEAVPNLAICLDSVYELIGYRHLGNAIVRNGRVIAWGDGEELSTAMSYYNDHPWHLPMGEKAALEEAGIDVGAYLDSLHIAEGVFQDFDTWCVYLELHVPLLPPPSQDVIDVEIVYASSNPGTVSGRHGKYREPAVAAPPVKFNVIDRRSNRASP
jgi:hypothetical protein